MHWRLLTSILTFFSEISHFILKQQQKKRPHKRVRSPQWEPRSPVSKSPASSLKAKPWSSLQIPILSLTVGSGTPSFMKVFPMERGQRFRFCRGILYPVKDQEHPPQGMAERALSACSLGRGIPDMPVAGQTQPLWTPPSPAGLPPPAGHSLWQQRHAVRGSPQICRLGACWTLPMLELMCAFFFSSLLQEPRQRRRECKQRDGALITLAKTRLSLPPFAAVPLCCIPANSNSMRASPIVYPSSRTITASPLVNLKSRNPLASLRGGPSPAPKFRWAQVVYSLDFTAAMLTTYWVTTPFVVQEKNNFWKCNRFYRQSFLALCVFH